MFKMLGIWRLWGSGTEELRPGAFGQDHNEWKGSLGQLIYYRSCILVYNSKVLAAVQRLFTDLIGIAKYIFS